ATMFFQYEEGNDRDRTMWGESPAEVAKSLLAAGADVVGMNCGRGPDRAIVIIREMRAVTDAPLVAYPNAGLPVTTGDSVTYELGPEAMAREYPALLDPRAHPPDRRGRPVPPAVTAVGAVRVLADVPLAIDPAEVLRFQGYQAGVDVPPADVRALFDEALALGRTLMAP